MIYIIIAILVIDYLIDFLVGRLNVKSAAAELPEEFVEFYDADKYRKSQQYLKDNTNFSAFQSGFFLALTLIFILLGGFNYLDKFARSFNFGLIPTALIFTGSLFFIQQLLSIPFSLYHTFVIETKYGFNRMTPATFVLDLIKSWVLSAIIGSIVVSLVVWFFVKQGQVAWVYCWVFLALFELFLVFISPVIIMPIFNKFKPLAEGALKSALEAYAQKIGFKMQGVFTMDGSRRSAKANAFFTGFGKYRRIVLYDTLISNHTVSELVAILAHEMGHYKKKHIFAMIVFSILSLGITFYLLNLFINNPSLFKAFKMDNFSIYASLVFFGFLYPPISLILSILSNLLSRKNEYEADLYSVETYGDPSSMINALKKLSVDNLSNLTPHPLKVFFDYSHPPVLKRIKKLKAFN